MWKVQPFFCHSKEDTLFSIDCNLQYIIFTAGSILKIAGFICFSGSLNSLFYSENTCMHFCTCHARVPIKCRSVFFFSLISSGMSGMFLYYKMSLKWVQSEVSPFNQTQITHRWSPQENMQVPKSQTAGNARTWHSGIGQQER